MKDYNETNIVNAIKGGNPVYARGNSGKRKSLVFVWDGKADTLGFMTVCSLRLKTTKQVHSFIVTGDGMDEITAIT